MKRHYKATPKETLIDILINSREEIERLNKEIETLKQPQIFIDTQDMEERYGEELYNDYLKEENERLNNIINDLEKYLNKVIETSSEMEKITCSFILKYLKELKGEIK